MILSVHSPLQPTAQDRSLRSVTVRPISGRRTESYFAELQDRRNSMPSSGYIPIHKFVEDTLYKVACDSLGCDTSCHADNTCLVHTPKFGFIFVCPSPIDGHLSTGDEWISGAIFEGSYANIRLFENSRFKKHKSSQWAMDQTF